MKISQTTPRSIIFLLLLLAGLVAFYNSFDNDFLMDDFPMLVGNLSIGAPDFLQVDPSAKTQVYFRPVSHFLNLITFLVFGSNPIGYHALNLLLFVAGAFVFYRLLDKVFAIRWAAFWAAVLLLIHPINSVCVNYKNATSYPFLVSALGLALTHAFTDAQKKSWNERILALVWLAFALFCHEIAFAFPFYLAGLLYATGKFSLRAIIKACLPSTIFLLGYFVFRLQFASLARTVTSQADAATTSFFSFFADIGQIVCWYLSKLVFMQDIALMWDVPSSAGYHWAWIAWLIFLIIFIITAVVYFRKHNPLAALGLLWFSVAFIPVLFACFSRPWFGIIVQPFWLIMSSLGFFIFMTAVLQSVWRKRPTRFNIFFVIVSVALILPTAWRYNDLWGNAVRYSEYWMKISPNNFFPRFWLAYSLMDEKEYGRARSVLKDLIERGLDYEWTYGNLGIAEFKLENYKQAEIAFKMALRFDPYRGDTHYYLGNVYMAMGDKGRAEKAFRKTIELSPDIVDATKKLEELSR